MGLLPIDLDFNTSIPNVERDIKYLQEMKKMDEEIWTAMEKGEVKPKKIGI